MRLSLITPSYVDDHASHIPVVPIALWDEPHLPALEMAKSLDEDEEEDYDDEDEDVDDEDEDEELDDEDEDFDDEEDDEDEDEEDEDEDDEDYDDDEEEDEEEGVKPLKMVFTAPFSRPPLPTRPGLMRSGRSS